MTDDWAQITVEAATIHIVPVGDTRDHCNLDCWCEPVEEDDLVIHNAADCREWYDKARRPGH